MFKNRDETDRNRHAHTHDGQLHQFNRVAAEAQQRHTIHGILEPETPRAAQRNSWRLPRTGTGSLAKRHHPADVQPQAPGFADRIPVMAPSRKGAEDAAAQKLRTESSMASARYSARAELRPAMEMRPSFVMYLRGAEVCGWSLYCRARTVHVEASALAKLHDGQVSSCAMSGLSEMRIKMYDLRGPERQSGDSHFVLLRHVLHLGRRHACKADAP